MMRSRSVPFRILPCVVRVAVALCFLGSSEVVQAQLFGGKGLLNRKEEPLRTPTEAEIGIPTPVTGRVEALKGTEITFEIRCETKTPAATAEFLIRTFPSAGKIVSLTSNPSARNRAIVTYYADPNSSATADAFAFAVRYRGGRYSSEMRFDIDLVDTQAEIQVEEEVDFGEAMVGESVKKDLWVRNLGNAPFERQILLGPPWYLLEPRDGKLSLLPREGKQITVSFRPDMIGETSYFLSLSRSKAGTTKLLGRGVDPFSVVTEEVELALDPENHIRKGEIVLSNGGLRPIAVQARGSTRLEQSLEDEYILAPETETRIPVSLGGTDTAPFDGMVQFSLKNGYLKTARVVAAVVPGRLEIEIPDSISAEVINFEKVEAGRSTERVFTLANRGGVAVPLEFHVPEPFRMLNNPGPQLAPLSSVNISVGLYPAASHRGMVDSTMNVYGNEQTLPIRLLGNVVKPEGGTPASAVASKPATPLQGLRLNAGGRSNTPPVDPVGGSSPVAVLNLDADTPPVGELPLPAPGSNELWYADLDPETIESMRTPSGFIARPLVTRKLNPELRQPEDLSLVERSANSLTIGWTAPRDSEFSHFAVEVTGMQASPGALPMTVWIPYQNVEFERVDRLVKAKIKGLAPASVYELRVLTLDEEERSSAPSEAFTATTDLPMDWTYIYLALGIAVLVGFGFAVRKIYLDRRPEVYQAQYVDS